ncbi:Transport-associated protein [Paraburkholderia ribeironis]|uniref:Transport-associated protein n=1 Tax=Paraburkholderia ribeironis TaxID=1247936 RepID=A0A1N7SBB1_9BURK|nr:BON domain-containing protein [Paraburkholderia ribeironis]SIT44613.1 Transport-associated protein [Paraburkholderia ribeironis]
MNKNSANRIIDAMLVAAIASCATYANAQTGVSAPADAAGQMEAVSTSPPGTKPDTSIIRDVRRALRRVPEMDDSEIHIRASHGVVTLTGWVPETWQISRAGNAARSVLGVRAVTNRLKVRKKDVTTIEPRFATSIG